MIPECDTSCKLSVGQKFDTLENGIQFYKRYAMVVGFDVRQSTVKKSRTGEVDVRVGFRRVQDGGFIVSILEERHNHALCSGNSKTFLKVNRKLDLGLQTFIANCIWANIGPVRCFHLYKEFVGGYNNVGATCAEFCNFKRDFQAYIHDADAQLLVQKLANKKEVHSDLYYAFDVDSDNRMARLFWADRVGRSQFARFGDVICFDATYRTNKYVPF
nr:protein FAR1-RELATED SEQUENCE 5-like [Ipomoea batatas]